MSHENVEVVKRALDGFNRRDLDDLFVLAAPDFEWFPAMPGTVEEGSYRGRDGVETYLGEISDTWEEYRIFGEEFCDLGDRVLVLGRLEGRGRGSGVQVNSAAGLVFDLRDGKVSRVRGFLGHAEASRAAELPE